MTLVMFAWAGFEGKAWADDQSELFAAVETKNGAALKELLSKGVSPELRDQRNCTPLMVAAATNNPEAAKLLIENGAEVDAKGFTSQDGSANSTALILAAEMGSVAVAEILIEKGADVNYINSFNRTALFWAYKANKPDMIKLLEDKGATKEGKPSESSNSVGSNANAANNQNSNAAQTVPKNAVKPVPEAKKSAVETGSENPAAVARFMACRANMKTIEGAYELCMMENFSSTPYTIADLIAKKYLKKEPKCLLAKTSSYLISIVEGIPQIKCPEHGKTLVEMDKMAAELKKAGKIPELNAVPAAVKSVAAPAPAKTDAKKSAALKLFMEVFNKCTHDASVTIQGTSNETKPPAKMTQYLYYKDPSNFRSDTQSAGRKVKLVVASTGSWIYSEADGKLAAIPSDKAAELSSSMDLGAVVSNNINLFDVIESKDKNNNILIYIINKNTGFINTFVIDPKLKVFTRVCSYPKKGVLAEDNIYGGWKFGKQDDKIFAVPASAKAAAAK